MAISTRAAVRLAILVFFLAATSQVTAQEFVKVTTLAVSTTGHDVLKDPQALAIDLQSGAVFIADRGHHRIVRVDAAGTVTVVAGSGKPGKANGLGPASQFKEPQGIAIDNVRRLIFIADTGNHLIRRMTFDGVVTTFAGSGRAEDRDGTGLSAGFKEPVGLALDPAGNLYVADSGNDKIRMITPSGNVMTLAGTGRPGYGDGSAALALFKGPRGIAVSPLGVVYVADTKNHAVRKIANGVVSTLAGTTHGGSVDGAPNVAEFKEPSGIALDDKGDLWIADTKNHQIRRIGVDGLTITVAGDGKSGFVDGTDLRRSQFHEPAAVAAAGAIFIADSKNDALRMLIPALVATDFTPQTGSPNGGDIVRIFGAGFIPGRTEVAFGGVPAASVAYVSSTELAVTTPALPIGDAVVRITTPAGSVAFATPFHVIPPFVSLHITPADVTSQVTWTSSRTDVATVDAAGVLHGVFPGISTITASLGILTATVNATVESSEPLPPDPASIAPPLATAAITPFADAVRFLYDGPNAIQTNVAPNSISAERAAVVRGKVETRTGLPLGGVSVSIFGHPELGQTLTRADGMYDLVVNGGGVLALAFSKQGFFNVHRHATVDWRDTESVATVVMTAADTAVTSIQMGAGEPQVARASTVEDADGTRRATMIFPAGTVATMTLPDGTQRVATTLSVRATEYTVGSAGPAAMPAPLPLLSAYTYAMELSADEAEGGEVQFDRAVSYYVENFLGFPAGTPVPVGYYDRKAGAWIPEPDGRVIKVVAVNAGVAQLDITGDGVADSSATLATLGINLAEQQKLATLYSAGTSLWRLTVMHFSPFDGNFPAVPPDGATAPDNNKPSVPKLSDKACTTEGSVIECSNQVLGEDLELVGTGLGLHYRSDRMRGHRPGSSATIQLTGASIPANVDGVELEIEIAGQSFAESFPASPNQTIVFTWNGKDAYGREVLGARPATIRVGYRYVAEYVRPGDTPRSFGQPGGQRFTELVRRDELMTALWQEHRVDLGGIDYRGIGIGGWSLSPHHFYDFSRRILYRGDGSRRSADAIGAVLTTAAGSISRRSYSGDDGPATSAGLDFPRAVAVGPDGSMYLNEISRIRRVDPNGIITTVAGTGAGGYSGDGGPATAARISANLGQIAVGDDGTLYILDTGNARIRMVRDGIITTIAGNGQSWGGGGGPYPDGGLATATAIVLPDGIAAGPDGTVYFASNGYVERITADGRLYRVAGGPPGSAEDGVRALEAAIGFAQLAVGNDGVLFLTDPDNRRVRSIGPDGIIRTVAGRRGCTSSSPDGDGGPARAACIDPTSFAVDREDRIYIADRFKHIVRVVGSDGVIARLAGTGSSGSPPAAAGGLARATSVGSPWAVATAPDGSVLVIEFFADVLRRIASPFSGFSITEFAIPEEDGRTLYYFDGSGRHLRTVDSVTGIVALRFGYDSAGHVISITDADDRVAAVEWNADVPAAIVAPTGERTVLELGVDGYLSKITNPANEAVRLIYNAGGLLTSYTDARESVHEFRYDDKGRLLFDGDPDGGSTTLTRSGADLSYTVTRTSAEGDATTYAVTDEAEQKTTQTTAPNGLTTVTQRNTLGQTIISGPQGTMSLMELPDSRFGAAAPLGSHTFSTPGGLTLAMTPSRTAQLSNTGDPLSLTRLTNLMTINGHVWRSEYDVATRTQSVRSPAARTATATFDERGRLLQVVTPGLDAATYAWDELGHLTTFTVGRRTATYSYDDNDRLTSLLGPLGDTAAISYDNAGRPITQTLPGGRVITFTYDATGNVATVTPSGRDTHGMTYRRTAGLPESYTSPLGATTHYKWTRDRQLATVDLPDERSIAMGYDSARRLVTFTTTSLGQRQFSWGATGMLDSVAAPATDASLQFSWDGSLLRREEWSGPITGSVTWEYNNDYRVTNENGISYGYDADGLLIAAGAMTLTRHSSTGLLTGAALGTVTDSWTHDGFGSVISHAATRGGIAVFSEQFIRDDGGRITQVSETLYGAASIRTFGYDEAGRLTAVDQDGQPVASYSYDPNGNRLTHATADGTKNGSFDADDRLLSYSGATYTYTDAGMLRTRSDVTGTTTFDYDEIGNLRSVALPNGRTIEYVIDGRDRRVGKKIDGSLVRAWLYGDDYRIVAELDGTGAVVSRFVYGTRMNVPDFMLRDGHTYRIVSDHRGTPRAVLDVATGVAVQEVGYDEFGNVLADSNPAFQPFGFAGGLYDFETALLRFGARDYDPHTGRWTTKDPIGFEGGDANLYAYVGSDPINYIDPTGFDRYVLIVGDPGLGAHNVGDLFQRAANTYADTLRAGGHDVAIARASNVLQFGNALLSGPTITGGVHYFGHSSYDRLYIGEGAGAGTNLDYSNASLLSGKNLGPLSKVQLNSCYSGSGGNQSIASELARRLGRPVIAHDMDFAFSDRPGLFTMRTPKRIGAIYMVPNPRGRWFIFN
jgi:RHS repeat-associated protein